MKEAPRALVTGASRGIGKAIAIALAAAGFDIAIAARTVTESDRVYDHSVSIHRPDAAPLPGSLEETARLVKGAGSRCLIVPMDLTDLDSVDDGISKVLEEWGVIQAVVNNGRHIGPGIADTILDTPLQQFNLFLLAHGIAPIRIAQRMLPGMLAAGNGTFVTISSMAATIAYPTRPPGRGGSGLAYRMAKAAGHTLAGSLLVEHAQHGIRAFNVDPGRVLTERNTGELAALGFDPSQYASPRTVAAVVAWLATSPDAHKFLGADVMAQQVAIDEDL